MTTPAPEREKTQPFNIDEFFPGEESSGSSGVTGSSGGAGAGSAPSGGAGAGSAPSGGAETDAGSAPSGGAGAGSAPSGGTGASSAPSGGAETDAGSAPSGGAGAGSAPSGGTGASSAPSGGAETDAGSAPSGGAGAGSAPSGGAGAGSAPSGGAGAGSAPSGAAPSGDHAKGDEDTEMVMNEDDEKQQQELLNQGAQGLAQAISEGKFKLPNAILEKHEALYKQVKARWWEKIPAEDKPLLVNTNQEIEEMCKKHNEENSEDKWDLARSRIPSETLFPFITRTKQDLIKFKGTQKKSEKEAIADKIAIEYKTAIEMNEPKGIDVNSWIPDSILKQIRASYKETSSKGKQYAIKEALEGVKDKSRPRQRLEYTENRPPQETSEPTTRLNYMIIAPPTVRDGITFLGKIEVAKNVGHGWRVVVNAGTELNPFFRLFAGAEFGKARDLAEEFKRSDKLEGPAVPVYSKDPQVAVRKKSQIKDIPQMVQATGDSKYRDRERLPPTYFLVLYWEDVEQNPHAGDKPLREWLTYSELATVCGPKVVRRDTMPRCKQQMKYLTKEFDKMKRHREHPDTGDHLTRKDHDLTPWLFPQEKPHETDSDSDSESEVEKRKSRKKSSRSRDKRTAKRKHRKQHESSSEESSEDLSESSEDEPSDSSSDDTSKKSRRKEKRKQHMRKEKSKSKSKGSKH